MRQAAVYRNQELAGYLTEETTQHYIFRYDEGWLADAQKPAISLTLPKRQAPYESNQLFPFFANLLSEGVNRRLQSTQLHIDENDSFGLLLATARYDTIGAITVQPLIAP
ncbi:MULTISPECIES: HipA N-terminal domain-containing protein [Spirosoma]|uniref:Phosphatidylinositol kinase n=1 Tax=Spirosoma sordidisoli TaxID=2502893 RepID=A0A4Q2UHW4_9BACT|nr:MULTISPECIES: HipA N-terminal domain-containing protein [Spirosoma]RYC68122.1 phosphatidylinositol kinase [Spirosoma sordidisoli]